MKTLKIMLLCVVAGFCFPSLANAQIWDKIKEATEDKVENIVVDKVSDRAAEIAAKKMEEMLNAKIDLGMGVKKADVSQLPDEYIFEWRYELKMSMKQGGEENEMMFNYYFSPASNYFGYSMPQMATMFVVMDMERNVMVSYIEQEGQPMAMAYSLTKAEVNTEAEEKNKNSVPQFTVTKLPDKEFMGYNCSGVQLEDSKMRIILYTTADAGVSFSGAFTSGRNKSMKNIPSAFGSYFQEHKNSLLMYMKMISKEDKSTMEMEAVELEEVIMVKANKNYKFM